MLNVLRKSFFLWLFVGALWGVFAQNFMDLRDDIYQYIDTWHEEGILKTLPSVRPYPPQLIVKFLKRVRERGTKIDRKVASYYLKKLESGKPVKNTVSALAATTVAKDRYSGVASVVYNFQYYLTPNIVAGGNVRVNLLDRPEGEVFPYGFRRGYDFIEDNASVSLGGKSYDVRQGIYTFFSVYSDRIRFQSGMVRTSFGPFFDDGAIVSSYAPMAGHFSFLWRLSGFNYFALLLNLSASTNRGTGRFPGKYFFLHGLRFFATPWLDISIFESVMWGKRLELLYLMPAAILFDSQGLVGFWDNSLLGITANFSFGNLHIPLVFYADDLHFTDMAALRFNTRYKFAFQTGISWAPELSFFKTVSLNYLLVTPYMYTHRSNEGVPGTSDYSGYVNYQNYTHLGTNLGPGVQPNSDRTRLDLVFLPMAFFRVNLFSQLTRHGNASEGYSNGDGTIFDDGWISSNVNIFSHLRFLTQDKINYVWQFGLEGEYLHIPLFGLLELGLKAGFVWQTSYVVDREIGYTDFDNNQFISLGFAISY